MSRPSHWPLPAGSSRLLLPQPLQQELAQHPLSRGLYPVAIGHYLDARGHRIRRRTHTDHLVIFCHAGRGHFRTQAHEGQVTAGQVLLLPRGVPHSYGADPEQPWSIYWAHFTGAEADALMDYLGLNLTDTPPARTWQAPVLPLADWQALVPDVTELLNLQHQRLTFARAMLAAALLRKLLLALPTLRKDMHDQPSFKMAALDRFMRDNSHRNLTLNDLARFTGLSRYYFSKKFRQTVGQSPMRYFNQIKVEQAQQMLQETRQTVRQISQALGFDDPYYFSRLFKKHTGLPPRAYRQRHQLPEDASV